MAEDVEQPTPPINVLMVVDDDVFDRLGSVVRHLCLGMMDEPVRVTVLARTDRKVEESVGPCKLVYFPRRPWYWSWRRMKANDVLELIGGEEPDVVHCLSADLAKVVRRWSAPWVRNLVVHLTDLVDVHRFARLRTQGGMTAITATPSIQAALLKKRPKLADHVRVIPLGIPADSEAACLSRPDRVPAVLVTTPLTRDCGLHLVLRAMEKVVKGGQEAHLFVLSSGPGEFLFRRVAGQLGLRPFITFAGDLHDWSALREAMRGADFYILPGERRRFTISTLSAMASGLAILAPAGTIGDYLVDGVTASLFDPQYPRQLSEKWAALLADPAAARQLATGALDYIRGHHQASAMAAAVVALYRQLCSEGE